MECLLGGRVGLGGVDGEVGPGSAAGSRPSSVRVRSPTIGWWKVLVPLPWWRPRQRLAVEYGATDIVTERGDAGVARIKELTGGLGAHSVIEGVGTQESMLQAIGATRPGGHVGFVGVAHGVELSVEGLFWSLVHLHGGPAPVRRFLPELIELIWNRRIDPGKVFDLTLPLEEAAEGYRAMDERRAIKTLLQP